jgi:hypothetical protein
MTPASRSVLLYGKDRRLLENRRLMLQVAGIHVTLAVTPAEAETVIVNEPNTLLVLCHSLTVEECQSALKLAYSCRPGSKNLVLSAGFPVGKLEAEDELLSSYDGSAILIATIDRLLKANRARRITPR